MQKTREQITYRTKQLKDYLFHILGWIDPICVVKIIRWITSYFWLRELKRYSLLRLRISDLPVFGCLWVLPRCPCSWRGEGSWSPCSWRGSCRRCSPGGSARSRKRSEWDGTCFSPAASPTGTRRLPLLCGSWALRPWFGASKVYCLITGSSSRGCGRACRKPILLSPNLVLSKTLSCLSLSRWWRR